MKKVLIVDDDDGIQDVLTIILESENHIVESLTNGENVIKTIKGFKPDIVLLDVMLGSMDGREICKLIKKNKKTKDVKVIMISASHDLADVNRNGADDFIPKPFDMYELLDKVEHAA